MSRKPLHIARLQARRAEIAARLKLLYAEVEELTAEDTDLRTAEKVFSKLNNMVDAEPEQENDAPDVPPDGQTLTVGQMALTVLQEAGARGMTSPEVLDAVRKRWLPDLLRTSLSPPLSRLKKKGDVQLDGDLWKIATEKEPQSDLSLGGS